MRAENPFSKDEVVDGPELRRILEMPRRTWTEEQVERLTDQMTALLRTPNGTQRLRPIQALALYEMGTTGGLLGPIPVGAGKELICFLAARVMFAKHPLLIMPAHLVKRSYDEMREYAKNWRIPTNLRILSYQILGQANHAGTLGSVPPDLFVLNECFVPETKVETPFGQVRIDQIKAGDLVGAYAEETGFSWEVVECAWSSEPKTMVEVDVEGQVIKCTANHPFLTNRGWVRAEHLETGDEIVRVVQRETRIEVGQEDVLRDVVLREMANETARNSREDIQRGEVEEVVGDTQASSRGTSGIGGSFEYSHDREQSDALGGESEQDEGEDEGSKAKGALWQGASDDGSPESAFRSSSGVDRGGVFEDSIGQTPLLHNRYRAHSGEDRYRGGWEFPQVARSAGIRSQEGLVFGGTGLARVQSVKRRSPSGSERSARVYNLQVSGPHTYVLAGGLVVHNCHRIKNKNAAVSRRVIRHMAQYPNAKFVAVSGTILAKSIMDFAHIARWCLKPCPLPEDHGTLLEWSEALDEKPGGWNQREPGALLQLCNDEERKNPPTTAARMGFRRRLLETPGVVASLGGDDVAHPNGDPIQITVRALSYEQDPIVEKHFEKLRNEWATPSGWTFSMAMETWRHARTLALGLHYLWDPEPPGGPEGPWMTARKKWKQFVRSAIKDSDRYDSELQIANACKKGDLDDTVFNAWQAIEPSYAPASRCEWHDTSALDACQQWMSQGPGVVFTDHTFFAEELARRTGAPYYGAKGIDKNGNAIEQADPNSCVIASRIANSTGRNIQFWNRCLVTAPPHQSLEWEQMVGRFHRHGQTKDVEIDVLVGCIEHYDGWMRSLELAKMTRDTLGAPQKILIAQTQFPSAFDISMRLGFKWQRVVEKS